MKDEPKFLVTFSDGKTMKLTAAQIAKLEDRRKYTVSGHGGEPILRKVFKG